MKSFTLMKMDKPVAFVEYTGEGGLGRVSLLRVLHS